MVDLFIKESTKQVKRIFLIFKNLRLTFKKSITRSKRLFYPLAFIQFSCLLYKTPNKLKKTLFLFHIFAFKLLNLAAN